MFKYSFLAICLSFPYFLSAQGEATVTDEKLQLNTITTSMPFLAITPESRGGGMGDAGTALSASSTSIFWNTAMLNFAEDRSELSISYTPWLRKLTNDISLSYLSGYYKLNNRMAVTGALRFFSLGEITFTDASGNYIRDDKPSEFELAGGYAFKLSERSSIGVNGKFAYSNLTGGLTVAGATTKPGVAGIADISYAYNNDDVRLGGVKGTYTFGATINNIGNKVSYSELSRRDFIPMNLRIGNAYTAKLDDYNKLTFSVDLQKLLVPTPPITNSTAGYYSLPEGVIIGKSNDVGVISGLVQSFYDAPGLPIKNENGDYSDNTGQIVKGSRFKEEITEINIAAGLEYWYANVFALRGGFFYEAPNKGARQFFTFGASFQYNIFGIDISYLAALKRDNPLANTLRFTLRFKLGSKKTAGGEDKPE